MTTEDLLLSLPQPVAVCGNGRGGFVYGTGDCIDAYPAVIRLNNFQTAGLEKLVGSKTTAWCVNAWPDVAWRNLGVPAFTVFHPDEGRTPSIAEWVQRVGCPELLLPSRPWVDCARSLHAKKPSTGLVLLYMMNKLGIDAEAWGFDSFATGHYWDEGHRHDHCWTERDAYRMLKKVVFR